MLCLRLTVLLSLLHQLIAPLKGDGIGNKILLNVYNSEAKKYQGANEELSTGVLGKSQILKLLVAAGAPGSGSYWQNKDKIDTSLEDKDMVFLEEFEKMILSLPMELQPQNTHVAKRGARGSKYALSIDVPTNILSILIDLAKAKDMRAKAAANAEIMARIGRRK